MKQNEIEKIVPGSLIKIKDDNEMGYPHGVWGQFVIVLAIETHQHVAVLNRGAEHIVWVGNIERIIQI